MVAAFHTIAISYVLLRPEPLFDQPAWVYFRQVFRDEDRLGMVLLMIGMLRLMGLIINGARKDVTPMIRQLSAGISCMIWAGVQTATPNLASLAYGSPSFACLR